MPERLQTHELEKLPGLWSEVVKSFIKLLGKNKSLTSDAVSRVLRDHGFSLEKIEVSDQTLTLFATKITIEGKKHQVKFSLDAQAGLNLSLNKALVFLKLIYDVTAKIF